MTTEATSAPAAPPTFAIDLALQQAVESPCQKSKRGAVAYTVVRDDVVIVLGQGRNGPPLRRLDCDGTDTCRAMCGERCVHAEARAIAAMHKVMHREQIMPGRVDLVHVKAVDGKLVAGGPPSCWPCANLVAEEEIGAVWLYEDMFEGPRWTRWVNAIFYESTLMRQPKSPTYLPRNGIEQPCLWCRAQDGAKRDRRGFWRCNRCKEPGQ